MTVYYLPSCRFKAAHPETSRALQSWLRDKGVKVCGCCRVSQNLFQAGDLVLNNCSSCAAITDEASPQADEISLYEYLLQDTAFPWPDHHGERITVQDCYRTIHKPHVQHAIRECLKRMNMVPVEIEENFDRTLFDGPFRYRPLAKSNLELAPRFYGKIRDEYIEIIPKEEQIQRMKEWAEQYQTGRVAVYCNSCLEGVLMGGADGVHILDLMAENIL